MLIKSMNETVSMGSIIQLFGRSCLIHLLATLVLYTSSFPIDYYSYYSRIHLNAEWLKT